MFAERQVVGFGSGFPDVRFMEDVRLSASPALSGRTGTALRLNPTSSILTGLSAALKIYYFVIMIRPVMAQIYVHIAKYFKIQLYK